MKMNKHKEILKNIVIFLLFFSVLNMNGISLEKEKLSDLSLLLPEINLWKSVEDPQSYFPETLFEYINGAAEIYIAYDFKELIVAEYEKSDSQTTIGVEIYDMGNEKNSFGIYSVERYPDNNFISVGLQGYIEEGSMNFLVGRYYVKLLCFDCEDQSDNFLYLFSREIVKRVRQKGRFPSLLEFFPEEGLIPNTEKFILRNFLGYDFFHDGYLANYKFKDIEFDCFLIEGKDQEEGQSMINQYVNTKKNRDIKEIFQGYCFFDPYYHNVYLARVGNYICGVMKINEGFEEVGKKYLKEFIKELKAR